MAQVTNNMVHGVAPVLQALKQLEPETYKAIVAQLKDDTNDLRKNVANDFPTHPWKSSTGVINWERYGRTKRGRKPTGNAGASFPQWNSARVKRGVTVQVGGRKVRRTNAYPILRIKQSDGAGSIYDLAKNNESGTQAGQKFVANLNGMGSPSRVMWKSVAKNYPLVEGKVMRTVDAIGKRFTVQIAQETEKRTAQSVRASKQVRNALGRFGR